MPAAAEQYITGGAGTPLGYNGPSNQGAGGSASAPVAAGTNTATSTSCSTCSLSASGSSNHTSSGNMLLPGERGVAGGAILAAVAAIIGAIVVI